MFIDSANLKYLRKTSNDKMYLNTLIIGIIPKDKN